MEFETKGDLNFTWSYHLADALAQYGVKYACISPGSRSSSLTLAFAHHPDIQCFSIIDERSAGYFAVGIGKATGIPAVLICTSGTATTNYYPAVTEASASHAPLFVCTADRPPRLQHTGSNQAIIQDNLYGDKVRFFSNPGLPSKHNFHVQRTMIEKAFQVSISDPAGPVHLNLPFEKPLEPTSKNHLQPLLENYTRNPVTTEVIHYEAPHTDTFEYLTRRLQSSEKGIIVAGPLRKKNSSLEAILSLSRKIQFPVIAEGLSQLRSYSGDRNTIIHHAALYFKSEAIRKQLNPDLIIRFGSLPTGKWLNQFLKDHRHVPHILINDQNNFNDIEHSVNRFINTDIPTISQEIIESDSIFTLSNMNTWVARLKKIDSIASRYLREYTHSPQPISEVDIYLELNSAIPENSNLFLSNSFPVRDYDYFAQDARKNISLYFNRGASGIDGILSSAVGVAAGSGKPTVLVTGDLAFFHDLTSLINLRHITTPFIIILIDNNGGGIFEMLPISQFGEKYEQYIRTPHNLELNSLIGSFDVEYHGITKITQLNSLISNAINDSSKVVLHIKTDAKVSMEKREKIESEVVSQVKKHLKKSS